MSTNNRVGKFTKSVSVHTNDPSQKRVTLRCVGTALAALTADPTRTSFGKIERDATSITKTVQLKRGAGGAINPSVVRTSDARAVTTAFREIEPGELYEMDITLGPPWPKGRKRGWVRLQTGVKEAPETTVQFTYSIKPYVEAFPPRVTIRPDQSEPREHVVKLRWHDDAAREILNATVVDKKLSARVEDAPEGGQRVIVEIPAGYTAKKRRSNAVVITIDDETEPSIRVPISIGGGPKRAAGKTTKGPTARQRFSPKAGQTKGTRKADTDAPSNVPPQRSRKP